MKAMVEVSGTLVLTVVKKPITTVEVGDYIVYDAGRLRQVTAVARFGQVMYDPIGTKYNWKFSFHEDGKPVSDTLYHWGPSPAHGPAPTLAVIEAVLEQ